MLFFDEQIIDKSLDTILEDFSGLNTIIKREPSQIKKVM